MQANPSRAATLYALGAIASWALLAALGVALRNVPPFLLTGIALVVGSIPTWPLVARHPALWRIPLPTLALGVAGLFGFHFLLFLALRTAPPVQANLVNYLWPLFIVVLAPVLLPGMGLRPIHVFAAMLGFAGAAVAILGRSTQLDGAWSWGYLLALGSALIWACYSLLTRRVPPFPTVAVGLFGLVSGILSLLCHAVLEPVTALGTRDWILLILAGLGPLGMAFLLWDKALKLGDPRQIGILSYLTPLSSTAVLMLTGAGPFSWSIALAAAMIISAAILGTRAR
ncbi:MAG: DMT family transporter [Rhodoferax sp.]|nr:DMT family transporter [Rhodoferax sp.]